MAQSVRRVMVVMAAMIAARGLGAQRPRGTVVGIVTDAGGSVVVGARVEVADTDIRTITDEQGRYVLAGVWPGQTLIRIRRVAFTPDSLFTTVVSGDTVRANATIVALIPTLPGTETIAAASTGRMAAFEERRSRGVGLFITRADIERRNPPTLGAMLRSFPGVDVSPPAPGSTPSIRMQRSASTTRTVCSVQLFVDGHPYPNGSVDDFSPASVEAIEVYRGAAEIPASFRTRDAACGIIGIWTRDPDSARRQP